MSNKLRVGIWGLGRAGINMHTVEIAKYPEMFEIVAGYDTEPERRDKMREKFPDCKIYSEQDAFLNDPEIDLVSVATRSTEHVEHALLALAAGKYVFLEKPIALNYAEAQELVAADKKYPGKLFLRHNRRFEQQFLKIREIIASGVLGDVYEIKLRRNGYQRRDDWQTIISCGGGQLNNWGPHIIDHALRLLESPVADIWSDLKKIAAVGDAEDHLKIILRGENGRVVDLEISGGVALRESEYMVFGSKGALTSSGIDISMKYINPQQKLQPLKANPGNPLTANFGSAEELDWIEENITVDPDAKIQMHTIWKFMYEAIRENKPYPITLEEGVEVVRVSELVKQGTPFAMQ